MTSAGTRVGDANPRAAHIDESKPEIDGDATTAEPGSGGGVNVQRAENTFATLKRALSRVSSAHRSEKLLDLEKDAEDGGEQFDLEEFMRATSAAREENGFRHKKLAVTWENLQVIGAGGSKVRLSQDIVRHPESHFALVPAPRPYLSGCNQGIRLDARNRRYAISTPVCRQSGLPSPITRT